MHPKPEQESMHSWTRMLNRSELPEIKMVIAFKFKMWAIAISFLDIHRNSRTELHLWMRQYSFFFPISWFLSLELILHFQRICFSICPAFHFSMVVISSNYGKKVFPGSAALRLVNWEPTWVFSIGANNLCSFQDRFSPALRLKITGKCMTWVG